MVRPLSHGLSDHPTVLKASQSSGAGLVVRGLASAGLAWHCSRSAEEVLRKLELLAPEASSVGIEPSRWGSEAEGREVRCLRCPQKPEGARLYRVRIRPIWW